MTSSEHPCSKGLTPQCFASFPEWAKAAFAYKLMFLLFPGAISRLLPKMFSLPFLFPGIDLPPGIEFPPGTIIYPGTEFPPGWSGGDPVPPGITIPPGTTFPPDWTPGDEPPDGVIIDPGGYFPPGWDPPDPFPPGVYVPIDPPSFVYYYGPGAGLYLSPFEPGPLTRTRTSPPLEDIDLTEGFSVIQDLYFYWNDTPFSFSADLDTWHGKFVTPDYGDVFCRVDQNSCYFYALNWMEWCYIFLRDTSSLNLKYTTHISMTHYCEWYDSGWGFLQFYDGDPPGGTLLCSHDIPVRVSATTDDFVIDTDLTGYDNLCFVVWVRSYRGETLSKIHFT